MDVRQFADAAAAVEACGGQILEWLGEAIAQKGRAALAISPASRPTVKSLSSLNSAARRPTSAWASCEAAPNSAMSPNTATRRPLQGSSCSVCSAAPTESAFAL